MKSLMIGLTLLLVSVNSFALPPAVNKAEQVKIMKKIYQCGNHYGLWLEVAEENREMKSKYFISYKNNILF